MARIGHTIGRRIGYVINDMGGSSRPPFFEDVSRWLKFNTDSLSVIDQIGDETRKLEPDRCIVNDVKGGGVILDSVITATKWAVAFRIGNYVHSSTQYTVGEPHAGAIQTAVSNKLAYREKNNFGSFPTFNVELADGDVDILMYSDNEYVYAYYNGNYVGKLAKISTLEIDINHFINSNPNYPTVGNHYDYHIWDLSARTAEEINTYFQAQAPNFHSDTMVDDAIFPYHRYLMNEKGGTICLDSGSAPVKIHGTYFYDDITKPVSTLHDTTNYPEILKNRSNREGWNKGAYFTKTSKIDISTIIIDAGDSFSIFTIFDEEWIKDQDNILFGIKSTPARYSIIIRNSASTIRIFGNKKDESGYDNLIFNYSLNAGIVYDIHVALGSDNKTLTVNINGIVQVRTFANEVYFEFTSIGYDTADGMLGYLFDLKKNGISIDPLNGSTTGTPTNIDFNKIVIPNDPSNISYDIFGRESLYTGIAKMNAKKEANGNIDFNPDQLESYKSYEDNIVTDPSFDDGTKWTGTNWADGTGKFIHSGIATDNLTSTTANPAVIGKKYRLEFEGDNVTVTYGGNTYISGESHVATTTGDLVISSNVDAAEISLILIQEVITHDDSTTTPTEIGELAFSFFNQLAYLTNPFNITPHFTDDIIPYINWSDVYSMTPELFNLLAAHPEYVLADYRGYWYKFYNKECGTTLTDSVIYKTKKTAAEQTKINNKKGCPTYTGLS